MPFQINQIRLYPAQENKHLCSSAQHNIETRQFDSENRNTNNDPAYGESMQVLEIELLNRIR